MNFVKYGFSILNRYRVYFVLVLVISVVGAIFSNSLNYKIKEIIDTIQENKGNGFMHLIIMFIVYQAIFHSTFVIKRVVDYIYIPYMFNYVVEDMYRKTMNHSLHWFDSHLAGDIASKITNFAKAFIECINRFSGVVANAVTIIISMMFVAKVSHLPAIVMLCWLLIYIPAIALVLKRQRAVQEEYNYTEQGMFGVIIDSIVNAFGVKLIGNLFTEWKISLSPAFEKRIQSDKKVRIFDMLITGNIAMFFAVALGAAQIYLLSSLYAHGTITAGDFAFVVMVMLGVQTTAQSFMEGVFFGINPQLAIMKACFEYVSEKLRVLDKPDAVIIKKAKGDIEFKDVVLQYGDSSTKTLDHLNFKIPAGQTVGIVGSSGSGKSSIVKALLRYMDVTSGEILLDNYNIKDIAQESLRANIGIIPQDTTMFHRTILENMQIVDHSASFEEIVEACKKAKLHDDIMRMEEGYNTMVGERGAKISGGQKQRLAIARAVLKGGSILILDEATSGLDAQTEIEVQNAINDMLLEGQITVIAIAHRLSTIKNLDRIIALDEGKIIEDGTFEELMAKQDGFLKKLWDSQRDGMITADNNDKSIFTSFFDRLLSATIGKKN